MRIFGVSCGACVLFLSGLTAWSQVPPVVNYQGRIQVQGTNYTGAGFFKFAIGTENMDTVFWSNDGTPAGEPAAAVQANLEKGLYCIGLGDNALAGMDALDPAILANTGLWLRAWFSDGVSGFEQLIPDQEFASAPYALVAGSVAGLSGFSVTNLDDVTDAGSGQIITDAERGQIATNTSNISAMNVRLTQAEINVTALGSAVSGKVSRAGDTMTGPLFINNHTTEGGIFIGSTGTTISVGTDANGSGHGLAVGRYANGAGYGAAHGYYADGSFIGAAMGYSTKAGGYGAAVGSYANGTAYGAALGYNANAAFGGLALGASSHALNEGIALGQSATADGVERIAIGNRITNEVDHSTAVRGTLYLDGGTTVYYRASAGGGAWTDLLGGMATGTPLYAFSEDDPVWEAEKTGYATGTPLYAFNELDPVWAAEKAGYATGTPLYVLSESDPVWIAEKAGYATGTPLYVFTEADPFSVKISGDTMTGALNINVADAGGDLVIGTTGTAVSVGRSANGTGNGAAVGRNANGAGYGAGVGFYADGSDNGAAIGYSAKGGWYGAAIGPLANGTIYGAAVGRSANALGGSAVGFGANGAVFGAALGQDAKANHGGVAVGYLANGSSTNIAIGMAAAAAGLNRIAIGLNTTNTIDNSAAVRGSLYLDGGTGTFMRASAGTGNWTGFYTDGTNLFFVNATGGVQQITSL
ncbi:MAG TPA: hypothetical protein PLT67_09320 [Kiritimatiellia bacterium]|nr:hypothetical protein [Kiritimatiellia bacterium]